MQVNVTRAATTDMQNIWHYIAQGAIASADAQQARFESIFALLETLPLIGADCSEYGANLRLLNDGDYRIVYQVRHETVAVLRVLHAKRDLRRIKWNR